MTSNQSPYFGFDKDARGVRSLWERFNAGLIDISDRRPPYQQFLLNEWQRCTTLGVDVALTVAQRLNEEEFRQRLQSGQRLLNASVPVIQDVGHFLDEIPGLIILTEATGCVLHITGAPRIREQAATRSGIVEGSKWNEASAGTNGMGTALATGQPVHVFATEHFCEGWHSWSCAAAPIFDIDGRTVLGVVDFTIEESAFRDQALALTVSMANSIQARMVMYRELERSRLISAFGETARRYPHDEMLALDHVGRVVAHSPTDRCSKIVAAWGAGSLQVTPVRQTIDVSSPESGERIGAIILLASEPQIRLPTSERAPFPQSDADPVRRFGQFLTRDPETRRMLDELQRVATTDVNVLIIGETGTGKELLARHLHACSHRSNEPYLPVNCGAISAELMESTFFGYVRGAFSGADPRGRAGYFESARGGTLFLDEVGELPLAMQAGLLRVLEDGSYQRVGSCESQRAQCRIIAATHRNLEQLVAEGQFRQDLYFRLKIVQKTVKPLRARPCDIPPLIEQFVGAMREKHRIAAVDITPEARAALERYTWPGNAREVRNVIEAALLCSEGPIDISCLPPEVTQPPQQTERLEAGPKPPPTDNLSSMQDYERQLIIGMLRKYRKANYAAKALGIARSTLYRKFAELNIDPGQYTSGQDD
ncbi:MULTISPECIES: sigma-54-dependent Fis family transcriptional regulator [Cupriavidus]|uniref:Sigma-54-dependent Fis family transcriptional regulator n=1 Tax=Cupriavidus basilensis TaxID=68895 RepID=A0A643G0N7_9BURK|nr:MULTISPECIES: sigma-54-dependent Fis family transcriptional regulator [Cupriavidus]KUE88026.1 AAA family ATPase [Cupriavidus necator]NOV23803.1 sigma-54-dependent Fis family transcriptional regulator [Cupriavidus necator]QOT81851.1 sigma-54-dependent Fis family transcriptional regulator [Cupriavidus basilensis]BDB30289.1 sigma-54-dependent Fis family transcriptional regulator [Cupriavidus sp. P-10]